MKKVLATTLISGIISGGAVYGYHIWQQREVVERLERLADSMNMVHGNATSLKSLRSLKDHLNDFEDEDWKSVVAEVRSDVHLLKEEIDDVADDLAEVQSDLDELLGHESMRPARPARPAPPPRPHR